MTLIIVIIMIIIITILILMYVFNKESIEVVNHKMITVIIVISDDYGDDHMIYNLF